MYEFNGITTWSLQALAIDFAIIIALFVSLKFIKGWVSNLHANDEITERDNFAFGISFAAGLVALAIVLSGVSSGSFTTRSITNARLWCDGDCTYQARSLLPRQSSAS